MLSNLKSVECTLSKNRSKIDNSPSIPSHVFNMISADFKSANSHSCLRRLQAAGSIKIPDAMTGKIHRTNQ
jgi:hypothetical protein